MRPLFNGLRQYCAQPAKMALTKGLGLFLGWCFEVKTFWFILEQSTINYLTLIRDHPFKASAFLREWGIKNWPKLPTDSSKKCQRRRVGVKNRENLPTSEMDGPLWQLWSFQGRDTKLETGLNKIIGCSSKSIWVMKLFFFQNDPIMGESFWQNNSLVTHILLKFSPLSYLAQSQILMISL